LKKLKACQESGYETNNKKIDCCHSFETNFDPSPRSTIEKV
jgi:hypothetical protein